MTFSQSPFVHLSLQWNWFPADWRRLEIRVLSLSRANLRDSLFPPSDLASDWWLLTMIITMHFKTLSRVRYAAYSKHLPFGTSQNACIAALLDTKMGCPIRTSFQFKLQAWREVNISYLAPSQWLLVTTMLDWIIRINDIEVIHKSPLFPNLLTAYILAPTSTRHNTIFSQANNSSQSTAPVSATPTSVDIRQTYHASIQWQY